MIKIFKFLVFKNYIQIEIICVVIPSHSNISIMREEKDKICAVTIKIVFEL